MQQGQGARLTWRRSCSLEALRSPVNWPGPAQSGPPAHLQGAGRRTLRGRTHLEGPPPKGPETPRTEAEGHAGGEGAHSEPRGWGCSDPRALEADSWADLCSIHHTGATATVVRIQHQVATAPQPSRPDPRVAPATTDGASPQAPAQPAELRATQLGPPGGPGGPCPQLPHTGRHSGPPPGKAAQGTHSQTPLRAN